MKKMILSCVIMLAAACAADAAVNATDGIAIKGYDPVAYFDQGQPVPGTTGYQYEWMGAKWLFSSKKNLDAFKDDPEKYAPQYGGYCAYGVSKGQKADIDPAAWTVHEGKLYLNFSPQVRFIWSRNLQPNIQTADKNWGSLNKDE
jgi:YHS domain-containing protein